MGYTHRHGACDSSSVVACVRCCGNVFNELLPSNKSPDNIRTDERIYGVGQ
jgi:hypothetical protein